MSIELCQSSTSSSEMWAKTPRFDASFTNAGSGVCSNTITGQAASRTILSIRSSACSELAPRPTSATSGRSRAVTAPTSSTSISRAMTSCPRAVTIGATSARRSFRSLAIRTRRCSTPSVTGGTVRFYVSALRSCAGPRSGCSRSGGGLRRASSQPFPEAVDVQPDSTRRSGPEGVVRNDPSERRCPSCRRPTGHPRAASARLSYV